MRVKTHVKAGKSGTTMLRDHRQVPQRPDDVASPPQPSQEAVGEGRGLDPLDDAVRPHDLAVSRQAEGRLQEAVPLCRQALALVERAVGPHHPDVANILNTLAGIYEDLGDYAEAVRLSQRSVAMMEEVTGSIEMEVLRVQSLCTRALAIKRRSWDPTMLTWPGPSTTWPCSIKMQESMKKRCRPSHHARPPEALGRHRRNPRSGRGPARPHE